MTSESESIYQGLLEGRKRSNKVRAVLFNNDEAKKKTSALYAFSHDFANTSLEGLHEYVQSKAFRGHLQNIKDGKRSLLGGLKDIGGDVKDKLTGNVTDAVEKGKGALLGELASKRAKMTDALGGMQDELTGKIGGALENAKGMLTSKLGGMAEELQGNVGGFMEDAQDIGGSFGSRLSNMAEETVRTATTTATSSGIPNQRILTGDEEADTTARNKAMTDQNEGWEDDDEEDEDGAPSWLTRAVNVLNPGKPAFGQESLVNFKSLPGVGTTNIQEALSNNPIGNTLKKAQDVAGNVDNLKAGVVNKAVSMSSAAVTKKGVLSNALSDATSTMTSDGRSVLPNIQTTLQSGSGNILQRITTRGKQLFSSAKAPLPSNVMEENTPSSVMAKAPQALNSVVSNAMSKVPSLPKPTTNISSVFDKSDLGGITSNNAREMTPFMVTDTDTDPSVATPITTYSGLTSETEL